jgi:macrolide-specific efflux system membrane fusion protein
MTAEVHIVLGEAKNVLTIPSAALTKVPGGGYSVQVVGADENISIRKVEVGFNNKISAEIRSGLKAGERVVTGEASMTKPSSAGGGPPPMF